MHLVMGIDGGGTHTRAWLAQLDGSLLARGAAGGSNVYQLGVEAAGRTIVEAAGLAWRAAGLPGDRPEHLAALFAGVAGAGAMDDQRALADFLARRLSVDPRHCQVDHDLRVAHAGALAGAPGAVLVAGTGSACYGRTVDRRSWKAGGWGPQLDDGGSGAWLGLQAMRAIVRAADGRGKSTLLADSVLTQLGVTTPRDMLGRLRDPSPAGLDRAAIARLAPLVVTAAACGDAVAEEIVEAGARELALMVEGVMRRLGLDVHPVGRLACAGGLLGRDDHYHERVAAAIVRLVPGAEMETGGLPPVAGAVLLALELAGGASPGTGVVSRLLAGLHALHEEPAV